MRARQLVVALTALCLAAASVARAQGRLIVPAGAPPALDGTVGAAEWARSLLVRTTPADLLFRHDDRYLYIGIRARQPGYASVCVANADTVAVLQAASAVGLVHYVRRGATWTVDDGFDWQLRGRDTSAEARAARQAYLREHGMLATTRTMNPMDKEIQIALDRLPARTIPFALLYRPNEGQYWAWPRIPRDGCGSLMLLAGIAVERLTFRPQTWAQLVLDTPQQRSAALNAPVSGVQASDEEQP